MISKKLVYLLSALLASQVSFARDGGISGGGGDGYAIQFVEVARMIQTALGINADSAINATALKQAILETKVESTDEALEIGGKNKDAINYPAEKRIIVSRQGWSLLGGNQKRTLVLHEYLGILRIDDSDYQISTRIISSPIMGANDCVADEARFKAEEAFAFAKAGYPVCKFLGGDGTVTLNGTYLMTLNGMSIDKEGSVAMLHVTAECNSVTRKFELLQGSAGETFLPQIKNLPPEFCNMN